MSGMKMGLSIKMLLSLDALGPVHTLAASWVLVPCDLLGLLKGEDTVAITA